MVPGTMRGASIAAAVAAAAALSSGCEANYPIQVMTPIRAVLDVTRFRRVVIPGFVTSPHDPIDTNAEMVRVLRSQLRARSHLGVVAIEPVAIEGPQLGDVVYWRRLGEEYDAPLIVTGTASFSASVERLHIGRQIEALRLAPGQMPRASEAEDRTRFTFDARLLFIDGGSGATLHTLMFRETMIHFGNDKVFALSAYFEIMDRVLPTFTNLISDQVFDGTRILLK